jgi:hypothetical protein
MMTHVLAEKKVELKVCEGCGSLWIRAQGEGAYCRGCAAWLAEFPVVRVGRRCWGGRRKRIVELAKRGAR